MAECCTDFNYGCNELVTWGFLKSKMSLMFRNETLYIRQPWMIDDYTPTYSEIISVGVNASSPTNFYRDRDGFIIEGSYDDNEPVKKCDLYVQTTTLDSLALTNYRSTNISECGYGLDLGVDCKFTRKTIKAYDDSALKTETYTWETNNNYNSIDVFPGTVTSRTTGSFAATCFASQMFKIYELSLGICKNPNASSRTITITPSLEFKGSEVSTSVTFTQGPRTVDHYDDEVLSGYTSVSISASTTNASLTGCGNTTINARTVATYTTYRMKRAIDTCGDAWSSEDYEDTSYRATTGNTLSVLSAKTGNGCTILGAGVSSSSSTFNSAGSYKKKDGTYLSSTSLTATWTPASKCSTITATGSTSTSNKAPQTGSTSNTYVIGNYTASECITINSISSNNSNVSQIDWDSSEIRAKIADNSNCGHSSATIDSTITMKWTRNYNNQTGSTTFHVYQNANTASCCDCSASDSSVSTTARTFTYSTRTAQNVATATATCGSISAEGPDWITTGKSGNYITAAPNSNNTSRCSNRSGTITIYHEYCGNKTQKATVTVTQQYNPLTITADKQLTCEGGTVTFTVS